MSPMSHVFTNEYSREKALHDFLIKISKNDNNNSIFVANETMQLSEISVFVWQDVVDDNWDLWQYFANRLE